MAKTVCVVLGIGFLLVGLIGFVAPGFLGAHLSAAHNAIHLLSGAVALYLGLKGSLAAARSFCIAFGVVYLALGVIGFAVGEGSDRMWDLIPGTLMLGTMDHVIHVLLGAIFLVGGFGTRKDVLRHA
jgi:hypothetical protein